MMQKRFVTIISPWKLNSLPITTNKINSKRLIHSTSILSSTTTTTAATKSTNICPSCSSPLSFQTVPICPSCSSLLPPPSNHLSHFSLFNISPTDYDIDLKSLKAKFREYQQKVHPDLFTGQGEKETWAQIWSSRVNDGWKILEGVRSRGEYLLEQNGVSIEEGESLEDPELLMIVMETREALEEAQSESEVDEIRKVNKDNIEDTIIALSNAFSSIPPNLPEAKAMVIKLRYLQNVDEVCREWSPGKRIEIQH